MSVLYNIKSFKYRDIILQGPPDADFLALEEEWANSHNGMVLDFADWLLQKKGFTSPEVMTYKFSRG